MLNEMAMRPTLEQEFTKIVNGLKSDYVKSVKTYILKEIERAEPVFDRANKESKKGADVWSKTFGARGPYNNRKFGFASLFQRWVFLSKEYAGSKDPKFKKEIDAAYNKYKKARDIDPKSPETNELWNAWKDELKYFVKMPESYWMPAVDIEATRAGEMFYNSFIVKNVAKFSNVIKGKDISEIKHNIGSGLTGTIIVKCSDGSKFWASFSVETSVSKNGKWFNRFPTRFHDVVFADGTKMKNPSEAKMKKEF